MKYCQTCGKQISAEAKFCEFCGSPQNSAGRTVQEIEQHRDQPVRKMHCPKCRSYNISPILESQDTGGFSVHNIYESSSFSGFTMLGGFSSKTKNNYEWLCLDCGKHFPNVDTLFEKANSAASVPMIATIFFIAALVIALVTALTASWIYAIISSIASILFFIISKVAVKRHEQLLQTALYWESMCFE